MNVHVSNVRNVCDAMIAKYPHDLAFLAFTLCVKVVKQVHDELLLEVPENRVSEMADKVQASMESAAQLKVPLVVNSGWSKDWGRRGAASTAPFDLAAPLTTFGRERDQVARPRAWRGACAAAAGKPHTRRAPRRGRPGRPRPT